MSEVLSAYYMDGQIVEHEGQWTDRDMADVDIVPRGLSPWQQRRDANMQAPLRQPEPEQEMSWTLIIFLLLSVTAVCDAICLERVYADGCGQLVAVNAEWLVDTMDHLSPTISKEWIGLILLPTVSSIAGKYAHRCIPDMRSHGFGQNA